MESCLIWLPVDKGAVAGYGHRMARVTVPDEQEDFGITIDVPPGFALSDDEYRFVNTATGAQLFCLPSRATETPTLAAMGMAGDRAWQPVLLEHEDLNVFFSETDDGFLLAAGYKVAPAASAIAIWREAWTSDEDQVLNCAATLVATLTTATAVGPAADDVHR